MTRKQDFLNQACKTLGLEIELDVAVGLRTTAPIIADAVVSQAVSNLKVYIFGTTPPKEVRDLLDQEGSGCSTFGEPSEKEVFDLDGYTEMFIEWGFLIYPKGLDCVWLASDRDSHISVFVTGGEGPIPTAALQSVNFDLTESEILELPKTDLPADKKVADEHQSFLKFVERGLFVYDWRDVHRTTAKSTNAYEAVGVPPKPLTVNSLPSALAYAASAVRFTNTMSLAERTGPV